MNRIYELAKTQGFDFNWIALPPEYVPNGHEEFDKVEMNRLFKLGYEMGLNKYPWRKLSPGPGQQ